MFKFRGVQGCTPVVPATWGGRGRRIANWRLSWETYGDPISKLKFKKQGFGDVGQCSLGSGSEIKKKIDMLWERGPGVEGFQPHWHQHPWKFVLMARFPGPGLPNQNLHAGPGVHILGALRKVKVNWTQRQTVDEMTMWCCVSVTAVRVQGQPHPCRVP